ncbi:MAG: Txe/YoeB family addiction module toxin [Spirochaetes bacterium]|nr:Txe/YoeB family addiction module toxin [Spirochaetota bacterium]
MSWEVVYSKQAVKDSERIAESGLKEKTKKPIAIVAGDPFQDPPPDEKLVGDLTGAYSRRINYQHRLVYQVFEERHIVRILRLWTHFE